ncbi:MAG TPA: ABC transporter substrate-binding protein [Pseudolabrys sp.]|jgi:branched-chain amino acid transport system substrate-binding protein|nr:ABC transporter substrate-binding protein [Pseudolabrys sp.]
MRTICWLGAAALALALGGPAQAETVKLGVVLPFSGANADLGHQIDKAFDLYVKLHAKDIAPHKVEIIKRDEGPPTGAVAKTVTTELITNDKVQVVTGFVFSPSAIALAPVITQSKVPMVIANAGTAWITNLSPYIVRLSFSMWHPAYPMGAYAHDKIGCKTAAMAYTDFPPGKDSTEAFKTGFEKAGGKITDSIPMGSPVQVPDFTPFFQKIKDEHPDCMYVFIPSGAHATGVMKAYGELGMRKAGIKLIGPMDLIPDNKLQDMGDAAIGTIVMGHYAVDLTGAQNKSFNEEWHKAYGADSYPDFMSAAGWDTMHAIFDTVKKLNGNLSDGAKVVDAMKGWSADGPRGHVMIDPATRDIVQDEHAMEVYRKPDGKLGERILGTTKAVKDECKVLKVGRCAS